MTVHARIARQQPATEDPQFAQDVLAGLTARPKRLLPKYFYDQAGAQLFEEITALPEYYPTRCELAILHEHASEIAGRLSGGRRADRVRQRLQQEGADSAGGGATGGGLCAGRHLHRDARQGGAGAAPGSSAHQGVADRDRLHQTVPPAGRGRQHAAHGFFPGSTIGNFEPHEACSFLRHAGRILGKGAVLIIGVDLVKDTKILNAAYDDAAGVTAKFNLNLLTRINRELDGTFDLESFSHEAFYNSERHRIEMHLASKKRQKVRVCGRAIDFRAGETIHTENSYKYTLESLRRAGARVGMDTSRGVDRQEEVFFCPGAGLRGGVGQDRSGWRIASSE